MVWLQAAEALETCGTIANQQKTRMDKLEMRLSEMHTRNMVEKANKGLVRPLYEG